MHWGTAWIATAAALVTMGGTRARAAPKPEKAVPLTVAVLPFETKGKPVADLGEKIADLLTVFLSTEDGLQLVERSKIKSVLEELELGASGLVAADKATRIGNLVGAQVLVTGRGFVIGEKLYLPTKAISVETGLVVPQLVKGELGEDLDVAVQQLAEKLAASLRKKADQMVAHIQTPLDQVLALKKALAKKPLPVMAVVIPEAHIGQQTIDPAAQTELVYLMKRLGITVVTAGAGVSDWAREYLKDANLPMPSAIRKADVAFIGEAFSEFAGRRGNLLSVKCRLEVKAVDVATGKVLAVARETTTQVDLAEQIASKTALQRAGGQAAVEMLPTVVDEYNKLHPPKKPAPKKAAKGK